MKATGMIRRIDDLGRVVIPKEIRRNLKLRDGDPLEIFTDAEGGAVFRKYDCTQNLQESLDRLREDVRDTEDLKNRPALLEKIAELERLLKIERQEDE